VNTLDGKFESRISTASTTEEWIRANFEHEVHSDTVYISDNPWYGRLFEKLESDLHHYQIGNRDAFNGAVTHPKTMTDLAIEQAKEFENKRVIIHYLQPHDPWFTEDGEELFALPNTSPLMLKRNGYSEDDMKQAYESSLKLVLNQVERLLEQLDGKTIITADHGELLNDRMTPIPLKRYEHPEGVYTESLTKVPWFIPEFNERKNTVDGDVGGWKWNDPDREGVKKQLESLGYL
jgi:membrane-anchored protein YejM (alkaline phosphatase superfamily)